MQIRCRKRSQTECSRLPFAYQATSFTVPLCPVGHVQVKTRVGAVPVTVYVSSACLHSGHSNIELLSSGGGKEIPLAQKMPILVPPICIIVPVWPAAQRHCRVE